MLAHRGDVVQERLGGRADRLTAASVVFECAGRRALIALGNPCRAERVEITLR